MAKIFLDTNIFIDAVHRHPEKEIINSFEGSYLYISPLSVHIYCYIFKIKVDKSELNKQISKLGLVDLTSKIFNNAIEGPSSDLEDNIQLHSAAEESCDYFITEDKKLLKLKFFGKTRIVSSLPPTKN